MCHVELKDKFDFWLLFWIGKPKVTILNHHGQMQKQALTALSTQPFVSIDRSPAPPFGHAQQNWLLSGVGGNRSFFFRWEGRGPNPPCILQASDVCVHRTKCLRRLTQGQRRDGGRGITVALQRKRTAPDRAGMGQRRYRSPPAWHRHLAPASPLPGGIAPAGGACVA